MFVVRQGFVHMDVAARNVLLGENMLLKLVDFGQVRFATVQWLNLAARKRAFLSHRHFCQPAAHDVALIASCIVLHVLFG